MTHKRSFKSLVRRKCPEKTKTDFKRHGGDNPSHNNLTGRNRCERGELWIKGKGYLRQDIQPRVNSWVVASAMANKSKSMPFIHLTYKNLPIDLIFK